MNNKGMSLTKLIALIAIIALILLVAITFTLPKMSNVREKAFRLEATKVVTAGEDAIKKIDNNEIVLNDNSKSCNNGKKYCFTVEELIGWNLFSGDAKQYSGTISINMTDENNPVYSLNLKKNDEFKIIKGSRKSYIDYGLMSIEPWKEEYTECNCE